MLCLKEQTRTLGTKFLALKQSSLMKLTKVKHAASAVRSLEQLILNYLSLDVIIFFTKSVVLAG